MQSSSVSQSPSQRPNGYTDNGKPLFPLTVKDKVDGRDVGYMVGCAVVGRRLGWEVVGEIVVGCIVVGDVEGATLGWGVVGGNVMIGCGVVVIGAA